MTEYEALRQAVEYGGFRDANETEWVARWALSEIEALQQKTQALENEVTLLQGMPWRSQGSTR